MLCLVFVLMRLVFVWRTLPSSGSGLRIDTVSLRTHATFRIALGNAACVGYLCSVLSCPVLSCLLGGVLVCVF